VEDIYIDLYIIGYPIKCGKNGEFKQTTHAVTEASMMAVAIASSKLP